MAEPRYMGCWKSKDGLIVQLAQHELCTTKMQLLLTCSWFADDAGHHNFRGPPFPRSIFLCSWPSV